MSDVVKRLSEIEERASVHAHFVGIYGRNDGGDDRAFLFALVRKYREALKNMDCTCYGSGENGAGPCQGWVHCDRTNARDALSYNPNESEAKK